MKPTRTRFDPETASWIFVVAACSVFVLTIMLVWSRLRGY